MTQNSASTDTTGDGCWGCQLYFCRRYKRTSSPMPCWISFNPQPISFWEYLLGDG